MTSSITAEVSPDCTPVATAVPVPRMQSPLSTVASKLTVPLMSDGRYMPIW